MATWNITANAVASANEDTTPSGSNSAGAAPGDFDGATITDVSVSGTPTLDSNGTTDDTLGVRWRIQTTGGVAVWGDYGTDAASLCSASLGNGVANDTITDGSSPSPAPSTATAADWDEVGWQVNYVKNGKDDNEDASWSSFTIVVTYTPPAGPNGYEDYIRTNRVTKPYLRM